MYFELLANNARVECCCIAEVMAEADVSPAPKLSIRFVGLGQFGLFMENLLVALGGW